MSIPHHRYGLRRLAALALALALVTSLVAQPALAAAPRVVAQQAEQKPAGATSYAVSCQDGVCSIAFDLGGEMQSSSEVPAGMPIKLDLPAGAVPLLAKGAGLEIGDSITVTLPFGSIKMKDGDFSLHLDENGKLDRLHGKSTSIVPSLNLGPNLKIAGPFGAEIGYDYGSTLSGLSTVLDPDKRYLFANKAMCDQLLMASDTGEPVGRTDLFFATREREAHPENTAWHTFGELCQDTDAITLERDMACVFEES